VSVSAGVGRTGAFVVIDSMLERLKHVRTVDIYGDVTCLRAQRNYMVQTEDQYVFIHDAVLEAITAGNTEIPARGLYAHVQRMSDRPADAVAAATGIQLEYRVRPSANTFRYTVAIYPTFSPTTAYPFFFRTDSTQWRSQKFSTGGASIYSIPFCPFPFSCPTKSAVQSKNVITYHTA